MSATQPPPAGPSRNDAARIGVVATPTSIPRGRVTGAAHATSVTTVQNARPPRSESTGNTKVATASTTAQAVTTSEMRTFRFVVNVADRANSEVRSLGSAPLREP